MSWGQAGNVCGPSAVSKLKSKVLHVREKLRANERDKVERQRQYRQTDRQTHQQTPRRGDGQTE